MAPVTTARRASKKRRPTKKKPTKRRTRPAPWWGAGASPTDRWPGVTIEIPAVWHVRRKRWESPDGVYYFDQARADLAVRFFPHFLTHHIGEFAGRPFELMDYQDLLIVRPLFGWVHAKTQARRFRKVFAFLPKGSGKSPLGAGIGLFCAVLDDEPAAEVYAVAAEREQARIVFENAKIMVEGSPALLANCDIVKNALIWTDTKSTYKVLSSESKTAHGYRPHCVIFDELHAQRARDLYEALKKSLVKRRQPMMVIITHAGTDDETICFEEYEYARGVLSGSIEDPTTLPILFEAKPDDDWTDEATWRRVNPAHGITVQHDAIVSECTEARAEPRKLNDFLRYHLNRWVSQATAWIPLDWWDRCDAPLPPDAVLADCAATVGIDMAQKIDLASVCVAFRLPLEPDDREAKIETVTESAEGDVVKRTHLLNYRVALIPAFWLPGETLEERVHQDHIRYDVFRDQGLLRVTDGAIIDSDSIVHYIRNRRAKAPDDLVSRFPLIKQGRVGYDPAFATELALDLREQQGLTVVEVLQNYKHLSEACQIFEALIKARRLIHGGHRLLRWNMENVAIKRDDAGRIRPVKPRKTAKRIDGVVAAIIAISQLVLMPPPKRRGRARRWTPDGFQDY